MARVQHITDQEKAALLKRMYRSPVEFCRIALRDWFPKPMPWVHRGILAILTKKTSFLTDFGEETWAAGRGVWDERGLDKILRHFVWKADPENPESPESPIFRLENGVVKMLVTPFTLILMPRGFSKTTLANAANIYDVEFEESKFILFTSESGSHAEMQLQNVKNKLELDETLLQLFGSRAPGRQAPEKWREDYAETTNGITLAARGRGGQIRGLTRDGNRPDKIIFDDVEDEESVKTIEQRSKARRWFMKSLRPALKKVGGQGRMVGLATALHPDALALNLARDPSFITVKFGAIDRDGEALWADNMSLEEIEKTKQSYIIQGELDSFYLEYFNEVRNVDTALFVKENFRYQIMLRTEFTGVALALDPAIGDARSSDYAAFAVAGITPKGQQHVLDMHVKRGMPPDAQIDKFFELHHIWRPTVHGIESNAFQKALVIQTRDAMFRKSQELGPHCFFAITPIPNKTAKAERIKGILVPRYKSGYITHQRHFVELETQLLDYPGAHDDAPDVVAMAIWLLDPMAGLVFDQKKFEQDFPETLRDIDLEIGEWRTAP